MAWAIDSEVSELDQCNRYRTRTTFRSCDEYLKLPAQYPDPHLVQQDVDEDLKSVELCTDYLNEHLNASLNCCADEEYLKYLNENSDSAKA